MKRLTDKDFKYTNAASTDLRKTFERIRREQKALERPQPVPPNVRRIVSAK